MRKAFTLIEILAVVTILGLLFILVIPKITNSLNSKKQEIDKTTNNLILSATKEYISNKQDEFQEGEGNIYCLPLKTLVKEKYLEIVKNIDNKDITDIKSVKITYDKGFKYEIVNKSECSAIEYDYYDTDGNGYKKINYLESTGVQYIDTGVPTSGDLKVIMDFEVIDLTRSFYFESRKNTYDEAFTFFIFQSEFITDYYNKRGLKTLASSLNGYPRFKVIKDKNTTIIENTDYISTVPYNSFSNNLNFYLFAINQNGAANSHSVMKLFSFDIYYQDTPVREYIPVIDESGKACLFDKIEKKSYYSSTNKDFLYG